MNNNDNDKAVLQPKSKFTISTFNSDLRFSDKEMNFWK